MQPKHLLSKALNSAMVKDVPSYGNRFFYSLGFLSMISFFMLIATGGAMVFSGPGWWLTNSLGVYVRSVHLWATQAFVLFVILHLLIAFFTSGFRKPRRLTWTIGVCMLFLVLAETEFGYVLRGDFSSQWRSLQGADFYNGSGLGHLINPLNYLQIYGVHIVIVPLLLIGLLSLHYLLVRVLGIAEPYRKDIAVKIVPANHKALFARGGILLVLILMLALFFPSPYIKPTTIRSVAQQDPYLLGKTLLAEFDGTSDTATYLDNINPYTYNTRTVYIAAPYAQYLQTQSHTANAWGAFTIEPTRLQKQQLKIADDYFSKDTAPVSEAPANPIMTMIHSLTIMAQSGLYEAALNNAKVDDTSTNTSTYATRLLADTGVLDDEASSLHITTEQYGMIREESGHAPGAWWLSPIGLLNHTVLANDNNGDRDAAIVFGSLMVTMLAFPFMPYVNQLPDKLKVYKLIWRGKY